MSVFSSVVCVIMVISLLVFVILFHMWDKHKIRCIATPISLFIGSIAVLILGLSSEFDDLGNKIAIWGGIVGAIVGLGWCLKYRADKRNGVFEKERQQELLQIEKEREQAIKSQNEATPWAKKYATSPCPYCGHYKVRCAKWEDVKMSVAFWGVASNKIRANYKCEHCGKMWE